MWLILQFVPSSCRLDIWCPKYHGRPADPLAGLGVRLLPRHAHCGAIVFSGWNRDRHQPIPPCSLLLWRGVHCRHDLHAGIALHEHEEGVDACVITHDTHDDYDTKNYFILICICVFGCSETSQWKHILGAWVSRYIERKID